MKLKELQIQKHAGKQEARKILLLLLKTLNFLQPESRG